MKPSITRSKTCRKTLLALAIPAAFAAAAQAQEHKDADPDAAPVKQMGTVIVTR